MHQDTKSARLIAVCKRTLKPTAAILEWPPEEYKWRHREENENSDVFYLKLTNEMCSVDAN